VLENGEPYQNGLLHGICRQWSESGRLVGKYYKIHVTNDTVSAADNLAGQFGPATTTGSFSSVRNRIENTPPKNVEVEKFSACDFQGVWCG
jgi:hypothetical protein